MSDTNHDCEDHDEEGLSHGNAYPPNVWGYAYDVMSFAAAITATVATFLNVIAQNFAAHNNNTIEVNRERAQRRLLFDDLESFEKGEKP